MEKLHTLVIGDTGTGKTSLIKTMPKPVYLFSFDPGGSVVLKDEIDRGEVIVDYRFEGEEDYSAPHLYQLFLDTMHTLGNNGFFEKFGSVCLDSLTPMCAAMLNYIPAREGRPLPSIRSNIRTDKTKHGMQLNDWATLNNLFIMHLRQFASLPCHTLITGHISRKQDAVNLKMIKGLNLPGQSSDNIPAWAQEVYYSMTRELTDGKIEYYLLTQNNGEYKAATRAGREGLFQKEETPNIRKLIEKAGLDSSDKPLFNKA